MYLSSPPTCPAHLILFNLITRIILGDEAPRYAVFSMSLLPRPFRPECPPQHPTLENTQPTLFKKRSTVRSVDYSKHVVAK